MRFGPPVVDYRHFRLSKLDAPDYRHLKLLLYWPVFGLSFFILERVWIRRSYTPVSCALDAAIPFCEVFLLPYLFWFVFLVAIHLYALLYDVEAFRRLMKFVIVSYTAAILIYAIFPNCQQLRPAAFPRDNALTRFLSEFYQFDTNTNVCPSLHVIGSAAVVACAWDSRHFHTPGWRTVFVVTAALISVSTVFLKQHSILDVVAAFPVCWVAWRIACSPRRKKDSARNGNNFQTKG